MKLEAKEGLALLNGTQVSAVLAAAGLEAASHVFNAALVAGAMSLDAAAGSDAPFDPRIHALRGQPGQMEVAEVLLQLMRGSEIRSKFLPSPRVTATRMFRIRRRAMLCLRACAGC